MALLFAINQLEALAEKGNQVLAWSEEEDNLLTERFGNGSRLQNLPDSTPGLMTLLKPGSLNSNSCRNNKA
ncbi:hypothetical protein [Pedobacter terrae]|uniref:hypothetical protein n=1 Tax=Pedobacter terrae TaxID=405671 RepID=UPI002FF449C4